MAVAVAGAVTSASTAACTTSRTLNLAICSKTSPANLAYPLRPGTMDSYQHSWGGPSLAGAWAVHAAGGVVFLFTTPWIVKAITSLQGRLARRPAGAGR
jgi:hypothetical protein